jgi:hypothetical protein
LTHEDISNVCVYLNYPQRSEYLLVFFSFRHTVIYPSYGWEWHKGITYTQNFRVWKCEIKIFLVVARKKYNLGEKKTINLYMAQAGRRKKRIFLKSKYTIWKYDKIRVFLVLFDFEWKSRQKKIKTFYFFLEIGKDSRLESRMRQNDVWVKLTLVLGWIELQQKKLERWWHSILFTLKKETI